jgi:hypothetical protein
MKLRPPPFFSGALPALAAAAFVTLQTATVTPPLAAHADVADLLAPPAWVTTENGGSLKKMSDENSKLPKAAKRIFEQGLELAARGAVEESQQLDVSALQKAEERFSMLIDGEEDVPPLAPSYYGSYTNR